MKAIARKVEKAIIMVLIFLMFLVLITATIDLGLYLFRSIYNAEYFLMDFDALIDVFGAFLLVLIGIELLDTIKVYLRRNLVHVEVVVLVAIIALARKIVVLRIDEYSGEMLLGLAAMITALAVAYYLIRRAGLMEYQIDSDDNERRPKTQINKNLEEK
ncbi:phosphate-starvation-inducible PsiE family protein [Geofilum rhodophaeum]|uniref:phosphate-starvation-inducible PsiE family protein n=1 Tax=Geofilum rhodophaeum TaxID=1965019 RepID=UPI000B527EA6|nr:phosphate-starvation-inducible PsiE family protein [Geofilum rhodophaeum]